MPVSTILFGELRDILEPTEYAELEKKGGIRFFLFTQSMPR